jgi:hypothetical protein
MLTKRARAALALPHVPVSCRAGPEPVAHHRLAFCHGSFVGA